MGGLKFSRKILQNPEFGNILIGIASKKFSLGDLFWGSHREYYLGDLFYAEVSYKYILFFVSRKELFNTELSSRHNRHTAILSLTNSNIDFGDLARELRKIHEIQSKTAQ